MRPSTSLIGAAVLPLAILGWSAAPPAHAEPDVTAAIKSGYRVMHNHLGLMRYCLANGYASQAAVSRTETIVADADKAAAYNEILGVKLSELTPTAKPAEALGRAGQIVGPQTVGLIDLDNPAHPERVGEGMVVSLADNARAQKSSERALCEQMAAQVAPPAS